VGMMIVQIGLNFVSMFMLKPALEQEAVLDNKGFDEA
jgi:hypothetical protein